MSSRTVRYTTGEIGRVRRDRRCPTRTRRPRALREDNVKVTLSLSRRSLGHHYIDNGHCFGYIPLRIKLAQKDAVR
jgi:hypothetical protein